MTEIDHIISTLQRTFEKNAWHGPSVNEALQNITPEIALRKLPNTHSIIELVNHMAAWRVYTTKILQGDASYKVTDELNFPVSSDWLKALKDLQESQHNLISAIKSFKEENLQDTLPNTENNYTYYTLLHGIIHHDVYHAGQIMLLKKTLM